jgi:ribosomal protein S6--L-glutamate ligase
LLWGIIQLKKTIMNIAILSAAGNSGFSNTKIIDELLRRGHKYGVWHPRDLSAICRNRDSVYHRGNIVFKNEIDAIILRAADPYALAMARHLTGNLGVPTVNNPLGMLLCQDKWATHQMLSASAIPTPKTVFLQKLHDGQLDKIVRALGGWPLIGKPNDGAGGRGVRLFRKEDRGSLETMVEKSNGVILQEHVEFIADVRALVINGRVAAAMQRIPAAGDFRGNLSAGGSAREIQLTNIETNLACVAAEQLGMADFCGVDLLRLEKNEAVVLEINGSPGLKIADVCPNAKAVEALVDFAEHLAKGNSRAIPVGSEDTKRPQGAVLRPDWQAAEQSAEYDPKNAPWNVQAHDQLREMGLI